MAQLADSVRLATPLARFGKVVRTASKQGVASSSLAGRGILLESYSIQRINRDHSSAGRASPIRAYPLSCLHVHGLGNPSGRMARRRFRVSSAQHFRVFSRRDNSRCFLSHLPLPRSSEVASDSTLFSIRAATSSCSNTWPLSTCAKPFSTWRTNHWS